MLERVMKDVANVTNVNRELEESVKDLLDNTKTQERKEKRLRKRLKQLEQIAVSHGITLPSSPRIGTHPTPGGSGTSKNHSNSMSSNATNNWSSQFTGVIGEIERDKDRDEHKEKDTTTISHDRNFSGFSMGSHTSVQSGHSLHSLNNDFHSRRVGTNPSTLRPLSSTTKGSTPGQYVNTSQVPQPLLQQQQQPEHINTLLYTVSAPSPQTMPITSTSTNLNYNNILPTTNIPITSPLSVSTPVGTPSILTPTTNTITDTASSVNNKTHVINTIVPRLLLTNIANEKCNKLDACLSRRHQPLIPFIPLISVELD
ncbi:hypothetical protein RFI_02386 [Reticulomyxa filosa]|uniref:Uncharacterized protein n=1 Tax=Reticulomyxa filosa TaxID=46433 RepID=X6PAM9_RETFI|nr:hypothetical protein RFI_02386 [Reticulomyxa filosa]|eukprot:ETO34702.1 hypothetical protein RFI_02386 [Reticulomyxa filosa]